MPIVDENVPTDQKKGSSVNRRVLHTDIEFAWVRDLYPIGQAPRVKVKYPVSP